MALTKITSAGVKDNELVNADLHTAANIDGSKLADDSISLAKLEHGTSSNNGKFLRANDGADPTFETINQLVATNVIALYDQDSTPNQRLLASAEGVTIQGTSAAVSKLMFRDRTTANFLKFKPVDTLPATVEFTLPSADGSTGQFLKTDGNGALSFAQASSPEVYGFNTDSNGNLIVTTTNGGADNISGTAFDAFEDVIFAATGFTFSVNANGKLIATI